MGPDLPILNAETGVVFVVVVVDFLGLLSLFRMVEVQVTALAARDSGAAFPPGEPSLQDDAAESKASVISESSNPPVPVEITTAHFPTAARIQ